jgi:predicted amidohydrolase YtcJ
MSGLVLHGGTVFDGERALPAGTAVGVRGGVVVAVGPDDVVRAALGRPDDVVDLAGRLLAPGFTDAHVHPVMAGVERLGCDLTGASGADDVLARVAAFARSHPDEDWLTGGGWAKEHFEGGLPTAAALDAVVGDRAVVLRDNSHHAYWVSSEALRRSGAVGTGTLHEEEMDPVSALLPTLAEDDLLAGLLEAQRYLHSFGVTGWQDAIVGAYAGHDDPTPAYLAATGRGLLTARVVGALWWPRDVDPDDVDAVVDDLVERRATIAAAVQDGRFRCSSVKIMQDGVVESHTAGLTTPYCDCGERGLSYVDPQMLRLVAAALARNGFQLHVHAIGDRAVREVLDALEVALADPLAAQDLRHHVAHLQVVDPVDVPRFGALGITANVQALWACHEPAMDELNIPLLGPERSDWQYPFADLVRGGAPLAMGSDWPVSTPDPLAAIAVAVTRREAGSDRPALLPGQMIDVRTALSAYTLGSARTNHLDSGGRIAAGALADLVVLDRDVLTGPADQIDGTRVDLTLVDGRPVWERS